MRDWWRRRARARAEAQRLLDGGSGDSPVAALLRAAAGPARPGELAGEREAVAAFRQAYIAEFTAQAQAQTQAQTQAAGRGEAAGGRPRRSRPARARVGLVAAALAAGAVAGTGVAAGAGRLPAPLQRAAHDWIDQVPEPADAREERKDPGPGQTVRAGSPTPPPVPQPAVTSAPTVAGTAAADMERLCKEWEKVRDNPHRKPMDPQDLQALTAAAGGSDRIEAFCGLAPTASAPAPHGPPSGTKSKKASRR